MKKKRIKLRTLVSANSWSYVINQNNNAMRLSLEGYGSFVPQAILQNWLNGLTKKVLNELSDECDRKKDKID